MMDKQLAHFVGHRSVVAHKLINQNENPAFCCLNPGIILLFDHLDGDSIDLIFSWNFSFTTR